MRVSKQNRYSKKNARHKRKSATKSTRNTRKNKVVKNTRRKYKYRSLSAVKNGGGCGSCAGESSSGFFMGGTGNLPSTNGLDAIGGDKIVPLNDFKHDPAYMQVDENATGSFTQGSAKLNGGNGKKKQLKKIKGGDTDNTRAIISGIQNTLPSVLTGASSFSNGGSIVAERITPVAFSPYSYLNPMPPS